MIDQPSFLEPRPRDTRIFVFTRDWPLAFIIVVCVLIELVLKASDLGLFTTARLRQVVYEYAGFWPGLLSNWRPNYETQPYLMFLTYGFLHSGLAHLIINMATLWSLGRAVIERIGKGSFILLYAASIFGGALGFGLLASTLRPMVGASGALFGLAGALLAWNYVDRFTVEERLWPVARTAFFLLILNIVLWWAMSGQLAWETHLGGFVVGWIAALLIDPRGRT